MSSGLLDTVAGNIEQMGLVGEKPLAIALYLLNTSRLLDKPLAAAVLGTSASGKSFSIQTVARLFPAETVYLAHRITPAALSYLPTGALIHRVVVAGERSRKLEDDQAEATRALREMISDGVLRLMTVGKDKDGHLATQYVEQPGPIAYVESTTLGVGEIFQEDKTRFLFLCCNESGEQTQQIMNRMARDAEAQ